MKRKEERVKDFTVPVMWEMFGLVKVRAVDLEEAIRLATSEFIKPPEDGEMIPGSLRQIKPKDTQKRKGP
jgi:hypothetical protein